MPTFGPIKQRELIRCLWKLGFGGPFTGGNHQFMTKDTLRLRIPNPHQGDISIGLLARILNQAGIDKDDWEKL